MAQWHPHFKTPNETFSPILWKPWKISWANVFLDVCHTGVCKFISKLTVVTIAVPANPVVLFSWRVPRNAHKRTFYVVSSMNYNSWIRIIQRKVKLLGKQFFRALSLIHPLTKGGVHSNKEEWEF